MVRVRRIGTLIARFGYDVVGRRIVKRVYSSASGGTVGYLRFAYRGDQVGFETDSGGSVGIKYTHVGTDNLVAITDDSLHNSVHYYVTTDKLGSVRALSRRDGAWALTQRFAPYGDRIARDTSASLGIGKRLRYGWTGREYDAETGFSFHRARYYSTTLRRWTQEDPIGFAGGANLYAYVGGAPLEATDPSGLQTDNTTSSPHAWTFCTMAGSCSSPFGYITMGTPTSPFLSLQGGSGNGSHLIDDGYAAILVDALVASAQCSLRNSCELTQGQFSAVINSLVHMQTAQRRDIARFLIDGRIRSFATSSPSNVRGTVEPLEEPGKRNIYINSNYRAVHEGKLVYEGDFFLADSWELAKTLVHEWYHAEVQLYQMPPRQASSYYNRNAARLEVEADVWARSRMITR
jgi:RHS repeat-associated protein